MAPARSPASAESVVDHGLDRSRAETAYYYPDPYWLMGEGAWVKSLLLFFDEVAILLPEYMRGREEWADPVLAGPLREQGFLRIIEPESFVDDELTAQVTAAIMDLVGSGAFDDLPADVRMAELSMSRMGSYGNEKMFRSVLKELRKRGLASKSHDGVSIPLHPIVRSAYLLLLAQYARHAGHRHGLDLHPTSNMPGVGPALSGLLDTAAMPSRGHVVNFDVETVGVDLDIVPLDEVLDFRSQHRDEHHAYMRDLRRFVGELSTTPDEGERQRLFDERTQELEEEARRLSERLRSAWKTPKNIAAFALGIVGAGWAIAQHDLIPGGLVSLGGGLASLLPDPDQGSAYSYLFSAKGGFY